MRKFICLLFFFLLLATLAEARSVQDKRRVEEEKRSSLAPTEVTRHAKVKSISPPGTTPDLQYLKELLSKETATFSDAAQVLSILLNRQKQLNTFTLQINFLKERKILPEKIILQFNPETPLRKGLAAYMFCRALDIKGGIILRFFGTNQRYALRELVYEEIMDQGGLEEIISGQELVAIFLNAARYRIERAAEIKK